MCAKLGGRFTCLCTTLSLDLAVFAHPGQCEETIRREPVPRSLASLTPPAKCAAYLWASVPNAERCPLASSRASCWCNMLWQRFWVTGLMSVIQPGA